MTTRRNAALSVAILACVASLAAAANWPQWRGPFLNGSTTETGLPDSWSKTENVAWVAPMPGLSAATPVVWGDRVFVSSVDRQTQDLLALCVDARSGKILWQRRIGRNRKTAGGNNMASPSAVTDGKTVWFYTGIGNLWAFDFEGKQLWSRELEKDHGAFAIKYGYSSSPLLYRGRLYVPVLQEKNPNAYRDTGRQGVIPSFLLAVDPRTGRDLWKHVRKTDATADSREAYITPIPYEGKGRSEIILVGGEYVTGHDPETGKELWRWQFSPHDRRARQRTVPCAVAGDGLIYVTRPQHRGLYALKAGGKGMLTDEWLAWKLGSNAPDVPTPLLWNGRLYVLDDRKTMTCLDPKTGKPLWQGRLKARAVFRASPTGADGRIYCISKAGDVVVLAEGDAFKVIAEIPMGGSDTKSSVAAAGGRLFIRTSQSLYCVAKDAGL